MLWLIYTLSEKNQIGIKSNVHLIASDYIIVFYLTAHYCVVPEGGQQPKYVQLNNTK
jgi:hypothetical protein